MPRRKEPPRLYLRPARRDRAATWVIRDGAREQGTGCAQPDIEGAKRALERYLAESYRPPSGISRLDEILVSDALLVYVREHAPTVGRPDLIRDSAKALAQWWGDKTLADIKGQTCRDYAAHRRLATSANRDLRTLRAAVRYYHKEYGPLPAVPAFTLPSPGPARERWLTRAEVARLLQSARKDRLRHVARFVLLGVYTGTRSQAMLKLSWLPSVDGGHVDLEAGIIHRRGRGARLSKKRAPPIRIPARLLPHLRRWQAADLDLGIVHVVHYAGRRVGKLRRSWGRVRELAGLGDDVIPHSLRHTAATWMMQAGVPIWEASGYLGMTVEMLERVYGHHSPNHQSAAAGFQGRNLGRGPKLGPAQKV